jgi:starch synthase
MPRPKPPKRPSVLIIASEALPFAKTGGLADVLGALPPALARLGWDATVVLPKYRGVAGGERIDAFPLTIGGYTTDVGFDQAPMGEGARAILIDVPDLFDRDGFYRPTTPVNTADTENDYWDNPRRFAVLARAALEFASRSGWRPSVVHAHDWHAGLAPVYLKTLYVDHPTLAGIPSVFTIHNLAYQGNFSADWLPRLDLPWDLLSAEALEFWGQISFLKGGINFADAITTVSARYAGEIQTPAQGFGFDGILRRRAADLVGILNGIDTTQWDPQQDPALPAPFSATDLSGKRTAKVELLRRYGLAGEPAAIERPLIGMISRMVEQKGFDLIAELGESLPALDAGFVVLGTGEARFEEMWRKLASAHPDRIGVRIGFDERLAHLVEAGADMFLMPSQWEPCGLNQMYSLRYGTVPVVRGVGGLADTVREYVPAISGPAGAGNASAGLKSPASTGFVFTDYTAAALLEALRRALALFKDQRKWRTLQVAGMEQDHSWDRSAREYVKIYRRALDARRGGDGR